MTASPPPSSSPRLAPLLLDDDGRPISTPEHWARHAQSLRHRWRAMLGDLPAPAPAPALRCLASESLEHFTRDHVEYDVAPGVSIDAYLLRPRTKPGSPPLRRPAVAVFHQTVNTHAQQPVGLDPRDPEQQQGAQLARLGYVVLAPRNFIFALGESYAGHALRVPQQFPGYRGMTRMLLDAVRTADVLTSLPEVDPLRLGCLGHSLGAKVALYAAAFDDRYRASVMSESGLGLTMSNWHDIWYLGPDIKSPGHGLEHHQLLALAAPRAILFLAGDAADDARSEAFIGAAGEVYSLLGARDALGWLNHHAGHHYPAPARAAGEAFLARFLGPPPPPLS